MPPQILDNWELEKLAKAQQLHTLPTETFLVAVENTRCGTQWVYNLLNSGELNNLPTEWLEAFPDKILAAADYLTANRPKGQPPNTWENLPEVWKQAVLTDVEVGEFFFKLYAVRQLDKLPVEVIDNICNRDVGSIGLLINFNLEHVLHILQGGKRDILTGLHINTQLRHYDRIVAQLETARANGVSEMPRTDGPTQAHITQTLKELAVAKIRLASQTCARSI